MHHPGVCNISSVTPFSPHDLLAALSTQRPIFHSEADFQHAFAWLLHEKYPDASVRLEIPVQVDESVNHIDILVSNAGQMFAIELKYKTRGLVLDANDEAFQLRNHSAQDIGRYDFVKDVYRLERFVAASPNASGHAILLTNDSYYWIEAKRTTSVDAAFRLHLGRTLTGELKWHERAAAGTMRGRETPIAIRGAYPLTWRDYSRVESPKPGCNLFRYLALEVVRTDKPNEIYSDLLHREGPRSQRTNGSSLLRIRTPTVIIFCCNYC
jgi:hypothetical protein